MKSTVLETFLLGVTFGIGITLLALYTQKPGRFVGAVAESGRTRRAKEEEKRLQRERLREVGFSDEEIAEFLR
jgi:predicted methyltransferase